VSFDFHKAAAQHSRFGGRLPGRVQRRLSGEHYHSTLFSSTKFGSSLQLHDHFSVVRMLQQNFSSYWELSENRLRVGDVNEILAWVDYCIVKRLGPDTFEKSIVAHLSHSCQRDFTFKQINVKVEELWKAPSNRSRPNGEALSGHTVVYRVGTKALRGEDFNDERAQIVKARVQQLMKQPVPEYAKPSSQSARKKRKVEQISTGDVVAKRLFKQTKRSHLNSRAHSIPRRSLRDFISVQVRRSSFVSMRIARETNPGASRSL
jgi:hypothetical protein